MSEELLQRLDEIARDAGREIALEPDGEKRTSIVARFMRALSDELHAALEHHAKRRRAA